MSKVDDALITVDHALDIVERINALVSEAQAAGASEIRLSDVQAAFFDLDVAEKELDDAIQNYE